MIRSVKRLLPLLLAFAVFPASARTEEARFRIRLREHFELLSVKYEPLKDTENYFGLTNTANLWYENPFHYAFGIAFGPVLGSAKSVNDSAPPGTDKKIRLWNIGFEAKRFLWPGKPGPFGRIGITGNILDTRGSMGKLGGGGYYLGLGWEARIGKIGLAPELAFRHVLLEGGSRVLAFTPSLGVHFYVLPADDQ